MFLLRSRLILSSALIKVIFLFPFYAALDIYLVSVDAEGIPPQHIQYLKSRYDSYILAPRKGQASDPLLMQWTDREIIGLERTFPATRNAASYRSLSKQQFTNNKFSPSTRSVNRILHIFSKSWKLSSPSYPDVDHRRLPTPPPLRHH